MGKFSVSIHRQFLYSIDSAKSPGTKDARRHQPVQQSLLYLQSFEVYRRKTYKKNDSLAQLVRATDS